MDLSIVDGFTILTRWQTWAVIVGYLLLTCLPFLATGYMASKDKSTASATSGCLALLLNKTVQAIAFFAGMLMLQPVIADAFSNAAWSLPAELVRRQPVQAVKAVEIVFFCSLAASLIPYIGKSQSLNTILTGLAATVLAFKSAAQLNPAPALSSITWFPLDAVIVGIFVVISALIMWISFVTAGTVATLIKSPSITATEIVNYLIGSLFGFVPLALYWAWIARQIKPGP